MSTAVETRPNDVATGRSIVLLPGDKSGCALYRMLLPGNTAKLTDRHHKIMFAGGLNGRIKLDADNEPYLAMLPQIGKDILVFQRPFDKIIAQCIPIAQAQGVACVVELDDDVRQIDPRNQAFHGIQPKNNPQSNYQNVIDACAAADWVTVSTPALRYYAPHGRVSVVPNAVPRSMVLAEKPTRPPGSPVTIGWPGSMGTHPGDLEETFGQVGAVVRNTGAHFHVIGDGLGVREALRLTPAGATYCKHCGTNLVDGVCATGWLALTNYPGALQDLDVGIVPLGNSPFNNAKSWLKGIEMAALGIPFVASPTAEYVRLYEEHGIGLLARRPGDWQKHLTKLITDHDYRAELGETYRDRVADGLMLEHTIAAWMDAWENAYQHRLSVSRG